MTLRSIVVLLLAACSKGQHPAELPTSRPAAVTASSVPAPRHAELAYLARTACLGQCPAYQVTIYDDGLVAYQGEAWVKRKGEVQTRITPAELGALRAAFVKADFKSFHDYQEEDWTDQPSAEVRFVEAGRTKIVKHYFGDTHAPRALVALEDEIDRIIHIEQFIGAPEERMGDH